MIPRFTRPEMEKLWSEETKFETWLEVEILAVEAGEAIGAIPAGTAARIRRNASFDIGRIDEIEREVRHDVIAFLTCVNETLGDDARYMHLGMTSSDMIDTALAVRLTRAADMIVAAIDAVLAALKKRIEEHRGTLCIGRSHGIHAEPTTFGLKLAGHYTAFVRARRRMLAARAEVATCALSGAVGTFATLDPRIEAYVAQKLGLAVEPVSTQVIPRDRHAAYVAALGVVACSIENLATEIRHLQRTEVREVEEAFGKGQKGSSAMPHKKNPILCENLTGLARMIRGHVTPAMENVTLWHERDISHSAVERVMAPDATILTDFALHRLAGVIDGLVVHANRMQRNLEATGGLVFSQAVLLALTEGGMPREEAYRIVQKHALSVWEEGGDFKARLAADPAVKADLAAIFDYGRYARNINPIIDRALAATE